MSPKADEMKKLLILGSTGSIGRQALEVVKSLPEEFAVSSLAAGSNAQEMIRQINDFQPSLVAVRDPVAAREVRDACPRTQVLEGEEGVLRLCTETQADLALVAVVGVVGLPMTLTCINAGMDIALANKETMVAGGKLVGEAVKMAGVQLYPVDSEHSAIAQCLEGAPKGSAERLILTASGGPFRGMSRKQLTNITPEQALRHPTWRMGSRVTVDSASLVNKGMEVMEARWLFEILPNNIDVLVHPQSIVHSMVSFFDGAILAQLGAPDMRLPIQWALTGKRRLSGPSKKLSLADLSELSFMPPDGEVFRGLPLAYEALEAGQGACVGYNAADEVAVEAFLAGRIGFLQIYDLLSSAMEEGMKMSCETVDEVLEADQILRENTRARIERNGIC